MEEVKLTRLQALELRELASKTDKIRTEQIFEAIGASDFSKDTPTTNYCPKTPDKKHIRKPIGYYDTAVDKRSDIYVVKGMWMCEECGHTIQLVSQKVKYNRNKPYPMVDVR